MKYILTLLFSLSIFASTEVTWLGQAATLIKVVYRVENVVKIKFPTQCDTWWAIHVLN